MTDKILPRAVSAVLASRSFEKAAVNTSRVNVADGSSATLVEAKRDGKTTYALYDDFGQLKATLPRQYPTVPTLDFVNTNGIPGAKGITVEIRDNAQPSAFQSLVDDLNGQMRPGFAEELAKTVDSMNDMPIVRDYGVLRNLSGILLEKYAATLSPTETAALQRFGQACEERSSGWSFADDRKFLLPNMSTDFASLATQG